MERTSARSAIRRAAVALAVIFPAALIGVGGSTQAVTCVVTFRAAVSDFEFIAASESPPTHAQCASVSRRCFNPTAMQNAYNLGRLSAQGFDGHGITIGIVDSFGSDTMAHDLHVFNTAFGLPHMCGEEGVACGPGMPNLSELKEGNVHTAGQAPNKGTGLETNNLWALEVALDVEWAPAIAPRANILLITTPTAEVLGVQGFPDFFKAEKSVIDSHLADVISQSFASGEDAFNSTQSLLNLRYAFEAAKAQGVTMLAASGDSGSAAISKQPVKNPTLFPFPGVWWPASDPLVTGVGGTYLCTDPNTGGGVDSVSPPSQCQSNSGVREVGWIAAGGGFSHVFARPSFPNVLPPGSPSIPATARGVPGVGYQARRRTRAAVLLTQPRCP